MFTELLFRIFALGSSAIVNSNTSFSCTSGGGGSDICTTGLPTVGAGSDELQTVLQIVFGILAAIAVLMVVIGGLRFVLSEGKPENISKARETIIYALVGLAIALLAEGLVSFVLNKL